MTINSVGGAAGGNAPVALSAQLARCEKRLGDWVACAAAQTPEGKKVILKLESQIQQIQSQIVQLNQTQGANPTSAAAVTSSPVSPATAYSGIGGLIDLYA